MNDTQSPIFFRFSQSDDFFGVSSKTMRRRANAGHFPIYKFGGVSLLKISEVTAYIEGTCGAEKSGK